MEGAPQQLDAAAAGTAAATAALATVISTAVTAVDARGMVVV